MLNLVDYGSDSDEGSPNRGPRSPNRHNKSKQRKDSEVMFEESSSNHSSTRSELFEPPPPKRRSTNAGSESNTPTQLGNFHQASSTASLLSMNVAGDGKEDAFEQADREANEGAQSSGASPDSIREEQIEEPKPPERQSQEDNSDEDEKLIDVEVEEAQKLLRQLQDSSANSPQYDVSPQTPQNEGQMTPDRDATAAVVEYEGEVRLPPDPPGECDYVLQQKFLGFFDCKGAGIDMNAQIKDQKHFQNPSSYERFIEEFSLDEKGSNFPPNIFDPHAFPENCFYEHLAELQRIASEQAPPAKKPAAPTQKK